MTAEPEPRLDHPGAASDQAALAPVAAPEDAQPAAPARRRGALLGGPLVIADLGGTFTIVAALAWLGLVALPLGLSLALNQSANGLPLLGVVAWLLFLRTARWLSPAARADQLLGRGRYADALAMCDMSLAVTGERAWVGERRLIWLNRRATALIGLGYYDDALLAALDAMDVSPDPETIATCALALLRLNRYEDAIAAARIVSGVTHERSVRANAILAACMLVRGQPAEAEALAGASLADIEALTPYVRRESYAACLSALTRARLAQGRLDGRNGARAALVRLRRVAGKSLTARAMALLEDAAYLAHATPSDDEAERLARQARALAPAYALWRLSQPDAPPTSMNDYLREGLRAQAERAPSSEAIQRLLAQARVDLRPSPARLSNRNALLAQIITVAATLALLAVWTITFFIVGAA